MTNKYYDSHGREIAVFDDVLSDYDLQRLKEYLTNDYHSFGFQPYDNERSEDHDNVAWISTQKVDNNIEMHINLACAMLIWVHFCPHMTIRNHFHPLG